MRHFGARIGIVLNFEYEWILCWIYRRKGTNMNMAESRQSYV
jgi:hypothetical protein